MGEYPTIELLQDTHTFPGVYMFKVIGRPENGFLGRTVAAVREALASDVDPPYRHREAVGGRHIAVTLQPTVQSAEEVLAVYQRLRLLAGLVMMW